MSENSNSECRWFESSRAYRGKKYAENTVFEEENAKICESGMHFCELPHAVFEHYSPGENHEFAEVETLEDAQSDDGRKYCTKKLKIGSKISVFKLCEISVKAFFEKCDFSGRITKAKESLDNNAGDYGAAIVRSEGQAGVGEKGVAIAFGTGAGAKAKGKNGAVLVLLETDGDSNIINKRVLVVDGEKIKENTFYWLKSGRLHHETAEENEEG